MSNYGTNARLCKNNISTDRTIMERYTCSIHGPMPQVEGAAAAAVLGGFWGYHVNNALNYRQDALSMRVGKGASTSHLKLSPGIKVTVSAPKILGMGAVVGAVFAAPFEIYEHYYTWKNKEQTGVGAIVEATVDTIISGAAGAVGAYVGLYAAAALASLIIGLPVAGAILGIGAGAAVGWGAGYLFHKAKDAIIRRKERNPDVTQMNSISPFGFRPQFPLD